MTTMKLVAKYGFKVRFDYKTQQRLVDLDVEIQALTRARKSITKAILDGATGLAAAEELLADLIARKRNNLVTSGGRHGVLPPAEF